MMEEVQKKIDVDNEIGLMDEMLRNITGFATHLFLNKIHTIIKDYKDRRVLFVWDGRHGSVWRKKANPSYKANRVHDGDNFYPVFIAMMNTARDILNSYPVVQFSRDESEADDVIYSIIKSINGDEITVVSTDSDMIQLVQQFPNVTIWNPISKKYHIIPEYNYVLYKSVMGDISDNIDGLSRYGKAKSAKVAKEGISSLNDEQKNIVTNNLKIIDMSLNPYEPDNTSYVVSVLNSNKDVDYDFEQIKKYFFDMKLKQQLDQFGTTMKLIKSLP